MPEEVTMLALITMLLAWFSSESADVQACEGGSTQPPPK